MPGPGAKRNGTKKNKQKVLSLTEDKPIESQGVMAAPGSTVFKALAGLPFIMATPMHILNSLDELSSEQWDQVAQVLCNHLEIPDLTKKSGLKKVYQNFEEVYTRIDDLYTAHAGNELIRGGIVAIYAKMCADSILRNLLFHKSVLAKILALVERDESRHLALRALITVTHHGNADIRREISLRASVLIKVLQNYPEDLHGAELTISVLAHAVAASVDGPQRPAAKFVDALKLPTLIPLVMDFVAKPGVELPLLHHALEFLGHLTQHCWKECFAYPSCIDFLIACTRSPDIYSRFYALSSVLRLHTTFAEPEPQLNSPATLMESAQQGLPSHLDKLITDYGMMNCETTLSVKCASEYQRAMVQCLQDRDIYKLGLTLAELITCTDFSIGNGGFQDFNPRTGKVEFVSRGLPFTMWADSLSHCAKAIRGRGIPSEEDIADLLDMKYCFIRHLVTEAALFARRAIERNPNFPYFYYILTYAPNVEEGLRWARKGLKLKNASTFVHYGLMGTGTFYSPSRARALNCHSICAKSSISWTNYQSVTISLPCLASSHPRRNSAWRKSSSSNAIRKRRRSGVASLRGWIAQASTTTTSSHGTRLKIGSLRGCMISGMKTGTISTIIRWKSLHILSGRKIPRCCISVRGAGMQVRCCASVRVVGR